MTDASPFRPDSFGAEIAAILELAPPIPLGQLHERPEVSALVARLDARSVSPACLAGLWLRAGDFDRSHTISQNLSTVDGSYWHGILHRHEPDYGNAHYWVRRVPSHPIFPTLLDDARRRIVESEPEDVFVQRLLRLTAWNPALLVDWCEAITRERSDSRETCSAIIQREWELLFVHGW